MKGKKRGILLRMDEETICLLARQAEKNYRSRAREGYRIIFDAVRVGLNIETPEGVNDVMAGGHESNKQVNSDDAFEKGLALLEELDSSSNADPMEY